MKKDSADFVPLWMLLSAGFLAGWVYGNCRHRKQEDDERRGWLGGPAADTRAMHRALIKQLTVNEDIQRRLEAVSKGLEKLPS
jgi:hypothetical protein